MQEEWFKGPVVAQSVLDEIPSVDRKRRPREQFAEFKELHLKDDLDWTVVAVNDVDLVVLVIGHEDDKAIGGKELLSDPSRLVGKVELVSLANVLTEQRLQVLIKGLGNLGAHVIV